MKLYLLNTGRCECDKNCMVPFSTSGSRLNQHVQSEWIQIPIISCLIDHPDGKILYDLGCNPKAMDGYWPEWLREGFPAYFNEGEGLVEQLALCNTKPSDIKTVVISHMHMDHIGNLELFTHADIYVGKEDFIYGQYIVHHSTDENTHEGYIKAEMEIPIGKYRFVDEDFELVKGVEVIRLPGHTPCILGLVVHLEKDGTIILPSDCLYTSENYGPPARGSGEVHDSLAYFASIEKVRKIQKKYNAKIVFSHDMENFLKFKHAPEYYE